LLLKTVLFKEVDKTSDWTLAKLAERLMDVMQRIEEDLSNKVMKHYFLPEINLLDKVPAKAIEAMRNRIKELRTNKEEFLKIIEANKKDEL